MLCPFVTFSGDDRHHACPHILDIQYQFPINRARLILYYGV